MPRHVRSRRKRTLNPFTQTGVNAAGEEPDPRDLMRPFPAEVMRMWPISTMINTPENDDPSTVESIELATDGA